MIGGKKKFKLRKKKKTLRCRELENEVGLQLKIFCFALPFSIFCAFNQNGNAKQIEQILSVLWPWAEGSYF